jgi:hypothetical protein
MAQGNWVEGEFEERAQSAAIERAPQAGIQPYETASTALAAAAKASVEARFLLALQRPRDIEDVRVQLLKDCKRPRFAEAARYSKPQGKKRDDETGEWIENRVEGPSARFAEAAMRHMGNMQVESMVIFDDSKQRMTRVLATDLETNATQSGDVVISKTVERRSLKKGQRPIGERTNSYGDRVYIIEATDDEANNKSASAVSKMRRNVILQLVPADIVEECMDQCIETQRKEDAADPDAARRKVIDAFAGIGVQPSELAQYLGHDTTALNPAELTDLRAVFSAIRDGETNWRDVLEARTGEVPEGDKKAEARHKATQRLVEKHAKKAAKKTQSAEPKPEATPEQKPPSAPTNGGPPPMPPEDFSDADNDGRP